MLPGSRPENAGSPSGLPALVAERTGYFRHEPAGPHAIVPHPPAEARAVLIGQVAAIWQPPDEPQAPPWSQQPLPQHPASQPPEHEAHEQSGHAQFWAEREVEFPSAEAPIAMSEARAAADRIIALRM